jgi:nitrogen regulatory protein P-II 1
MRRVNNMGYKKIECFIRPEKFEEVIVGLEKVGIEGINVDKIYGYGSQKGEEKEVEKYKQKKEYEVKFKEKIKLEIVTEESKVEKIIETIKTHAQTGKIGDGKIYITPVEESIKIRTT